jgi:anaerobic selenocysteine-containing dehydrogenase
VNGAVDHHRTCHLCEAGCGLTLRVEHGRVTRVRGDADDVASHGFLCPKGACIGQLHDDPDRLHGPLVRTGSTWREVTWPEAFARASELLGPFLELDRRHRIAMYYGNPSSHNLAGMFYCGLLTSAVRSKTVFSAGTLDSMPTQLAAALMFGVKMMVPIPDIDRTQFALVLGANPHVSNGSLVVAPGFADRLSAIVARGGRVVVVDPRRTGTADLASQHIPIRPGTDHLLLFALVNVLFAEGLVSADLDPGLYAGIEVVRELSATFSPDAVADACNVSSETIRTLARELAGSDRAVVYGRIGTCVQAFGTIASWLINVLNALTGNLDVAGGAMFADPVARVPWERPWAPKALSDQSVFSQPGDNLRSFRRVLGELPSSAFADEVLRGGPDSIRAAIVLAGNPARSMPDSTKVTAALASLDCLISIDPYLNETSRAAHVVLPPSSPLCDAHFDLLLTRFSVKRMAKFSRPVLARPAGELAEWEILLGLVAVCTGRDPMDPAAVDFAHLRGLIEADVADGASPIAGRDPQDVLLELEPRVGPERMLDYVLRTSRDGDHFGRHDDGLTLDAVAAHEHGLDLGCLRPRLTEVLATPSGKVEMAPDAITTDVRERLIPTLGRAPDAGFLLIGRRDLRSNNSWMHNLPGLSRGKARCTVEINPDDADRLSIGDGEAIQICSEAGSVVAPASLTDRVSPGVVSLPHGWGHAADGMRLSVAARQPGVNSNELASDARVDQLSGTAVLTGIPVTLHRQVEGAE